MAFPYIPSAGILQQPFAQFRKSFPKKVDTETLKRLGIAPSNEGYVIQSLKFLSLIDKDGQQTKAGVDLFTIHGDAEFSAALEPIVRQAYADLFDLRGDDAWTLDKGGLITFFRGTDKTSEIVGGRQANAFATLATLSGKRQAPATRNAATATERKTPKTKTVKQPKALQKRDNGLEGTEQKLERKNSGYGLTVRIEVNLPANGSPETYDAIFKSMRENLLTDAS